MDHQRFDDLTRAIAASGSRRGLLKGVLSAVLGGAVMAHADRAEARSKRHHQCNSDADCGECLICTRRALDEPARCMPADEGSSCGGDCGICESGICRAVGTCEGCDHCNPRTFSCESRCADDEVCCSDSTCSRPDRCKCPFDRACLNGTCCPKGQVCDIDNVCCTETERCLGHCCPGGQRCCHGECLDNDKPCCESGQQECGEQCCTSGETCIGTVDKTCCPSAQACPGTLIDSCCDSNATCVDGDCCLKTQVLETGAGKTCCGTDTRPLDGECCPLERQNGDHCCPEGTQPGTNGTCCPVCGDTVCCSPTVCISNGAGTTAYCCDPSLNQPCHPNGDGTYAYCCTGGGREECCPDTQTCKAPKECCGTTAQFNAAASMCCQPGETVCGDQCCDGPCDDTGEACCSGLVCGDACCGDPASGVVCCADGVSCCQAPTYYCPWESPRVCYDSFGLCESHCAYKPDGTPSFQDCELC